MRLVTVLAASLVLAACSSDVGVMGTRHLNTPEYLAKNPDKKTCKRNHTLGTNKVQRECHTNAEWAALAKAGKGDIDEFGRRVTNSVTIHQDE